MPITLCIEQDHPALPGHFPGAPIVPGVVLIEHIVAAIMRIQPELAIVGIHKMKFLRKVEPGVAFELDWRPGRPGSLRFTCQCQGLLMLEGNLHVLDAALTAVG